MRLRSYRRKVAADKSGAAAVEFAFIAFSLVLFTLGILDVGFALFWFTRAEKATQLGVRIAAVSDPVSDFLPAFSGTQGISGGNAGDSCGDLSGAIQVFCDHPDITCAVPDGLLGSGKCKEDGVGAEIGNFSDDAFANIFNEMRVLYPQLTSDKVVVEYRPTPLGFAGRPGNEEGTYNLVPQVTVRIVDLEYNFIALGSLIGLAPFTLPVISASMTGEDLDHTTALK